jgi:diguanylate cyclase (GGDEF)-like protein
MRTIERDYRYLLQNLVPHHRLPLELRRRIEEALKIGNLTELKQSSIQALEHLTQDNYYDRLDKLFRNGNVIVTYRKRDGIFRVRLVVPREDWLIVVPEDAAIAPAESPVVSSPAGPPGDAEPRTSIEILPEVIQSLAISDRRDSIVDRLNTLMRMMPEWLDFSRAGLVLVQEAQGAYELPGEYILQQNESELMKTPIYRRAISEKGLLACPVDEARELGLVAASDEAQTVAMMPIYSGEALRAILWLLFKEPVSDISIRLRADVAARIVERVISINDRIETMTSNDALTGIYNRHFYNLQLPIEIERATRTGAKLSMLLLDVDDFKKINDGLGHKKGDEALVLVADLIKKNLRKIDLPFRYGGEEFVILLPGTAEIEAVHTAERLRSVIHSYSGFHDEDGKSRHISVSIGVAVFPDFARTEEELFIKADAAMFRAKHRGKNRVELFRE